MGPLDLQSPWRAGDSVADAVQDNWLAGFGDAQLDALVAEALERNPDLRVAAARVSRRPSTCTSPRPRSGLR